MKDTPKKSFVLKLKSAIGMDGQLLPAGTLIEVNEPEAKDLLRREKAELVTAPDEEPNAAEEGEESTEQTANGHNAEASE
ncbi:hypothetical protein LMG31506_03007 [Cupriavidus yeoncheonensis]|uniref:Uncharacterized protein n=1 Tax=Cupriavidus yeoncheonensis TaxID=1462994 RepID=A0A916IUU7_9BURK|nr:hypothetical protein [Cupriavidus yeoncheonensis]CAG2144448.1 hypothetical protein LMG31506_03007 [Cupriavidus yeoncheonensis]